MTEADIVFNGESVTVSIPVGTYDWCIANPRYWHDDGPQIGLVSDIGTAHGRNDDYVFEAGKSYVFTVYRYGELAAVDVEITDYNTQPGTAGDVDGNGVVETADALLALRGQWVLTHSHPNRQSVRIWTATVLLTRLTRLQFFAAQYLTG